MTPEQRAAFRERVRIEAERIRALERDADEHVDRIHKETEAIWHERQRENLP